MGNIIKFPISDKFRLETLLERTNDLHKEHIVTSERFRRIWNESK